MLDTLTAPLAQSRTAARKGDSFETTPLLPPKSPVDDIDFGFLNDAPSIPELLRVLR